jgi:hypothetical protein
MGQYYPEDDWSSSGKANNMKELFDFFVDLHKDFLKSNWNFKFSDVNVSHEHFDFYYEEYEICNLGHRHYKPKVLIKRPEYFEEAMTLYKKWRERIIKRFDFFRCKREEKNKIDAIKKKEELEKKTYLKLKEKYEKNF